MVRGFAENDFSAF